MWYSPASGARHPGPQHRRRRQRGSRVFHQRIAVKAQIHTLGGFSAHAGQSQLLDWVGHFAHRPALYLIHGEREKMEALQGAIRERLDWDAEIPEPGERIEI